MNPLLRKGLIASLVIAVVALIAWTAYKNLEYVEEKDWRPLSGEARDNPLYASRLFLKGMGIPAKTVESLQGLTSLPDTNTVLIIDTARYTQREDQFEDMLNWVEAGGHLITRSVSDWEFFDPERSTPLEGSGDTEGEKATDEAEDSESVNHKTSSDPLQQFLHVHTGESIPFRQKEYQEIQLAGADKALQIGSDYYQAIELDHNNDQQGLIQIPLNGKNIIIQQRVNKGMITLVSDLSFIQNYSIDSYDHAEIFWHLVHGNAAAKASPAAVWLIHSDDMPNLFEIIWNRFWAVCIMLSIALLTWVLRISRRFGPLIPKDDEDRRNLMEHIEASGNYYWKQKQQHVLINSTRSAVQQRLIQRIPGWQAMSNDKQASELAGRLSVSEQQALKLLHSDISHHAHEFTEIIKQLEQIRTTV